MDAVQTGKLIRDARVERGLTQQALADALHLSATAVSKWENGHSLPDVALLEPLSAALGVSIAELVTGERSAIAMETEETAIRAVIDESVRQRRRSAVKWGVIALLAAALAAACGMLLFIVGFEARQDNVRAVTELQEGGTLWAIHFETVDGKPLYAYTEAASVPSEDGRYAVGGRRIHLRVAPLGHANPGSYTWGYSVESGLLPTEDYDFYVLVDYADGQTAYSMREEGLFG